MSGQYEKDISSTPARAIDVPGTGAIKIDSQVLQDDPVTNLDVAGRYLAEIALRDDAAQLLAAWSPQEEKRMVRRADLVIVPLLLVGIMVGYPGCLLAESALTFRWEAPIRTLSALRP